MGGVLELSLPRQMWSQEEDSILLLTAPMAAVFNYTISRCFYSNQAAWLSFFDDS